MNPNLAVIAEQVEKYYERYAGRPHAIKMYFTIVYIALISLLSPFLALSVMTYINLSRDPTVMQAEQNINDAINSLESSSTDATSKEMKQIIANQKELWNKQAILLSKLEKKVPRPDWFASSMKFIGWLSALFALFVGLSSTIIAWRSERRATVHFIMEMKEKLTSIENDKPKIIMDK